MKPKQKSFARIGASSGAMVLALVSSAALAQQGDEHGNVDGTVGIAEVIVTAPDQADACHSQITRQIAAGGVHDQVSVSAD